MNQTRSQKLKDNLDFLQQEGESKRNLQKKWGLKKDVCGSEGDKWKCCNPTFLIMVRVSSKRVCKVIFTSRCLVIFVCCGTVTQNTLPTSIFYPNSLVFFGNYCFWPLLPSQPGIHNSHGCNIFIERDVKSCPKCHITCFICWF